MEYPDYFARAITELGDKIVRFCMYNNFCNKFEAFIVDNFIGLARKEEEVFPDEFGHRASIADTCEDWKERLVISTGIISKPFYLKNGKFYGKGDLSRYVFANVDIPTLHEMIELVQSNYPEMVEYYNKTDIAKEYRKTFHVCEEYDDITCKNAKVVGSLDQDYQLIMDKLTSYSGFNTKSA